MVFIALFLPLRRCLLPLLACIGLTSPCCFAQPTFFPVESTPYDHQMLRVQPVLVAVGTNPAGKVSVAVVNQWMNKLRRIPYRYSKQWQTPREVGITKMADCKGKAMVLYEIMHGMGARHVRFVIGRHRAGDWSTHAWLEWETVKGRYVLDPTFNRQPVRTEPESPSKYIPLYAYEGSFRFRAVNARLVAETPPRAVASGHNSWTSRSFSGLD